MFFIQLSPCILYFKKNNSDMCCSIIGWIVLKQKKSPSLVKRFVLHSLKKKRKTTPLRARRKKTTEVASFLRKARIIFLRKGDELHASFFFIFLPLSYQTHFFFIIFSFRFPIIFLFLFPFNFLMYTKHTLNNILFKTSVTHTTKFMQCQLTLKSDWVI